MIHQAKRAGYYLLGALMLSFGLFTALAAVALHVGILVW